MTSDSRFQDFISKAKIKHGQKFDYSEVHYINQKSPVKIICPTHGEFLQTPDKHLSSKFGCSKCSFCFKDKPQKIKKMIFNFDIESSIRIDNKGYMHFSITKQLEMLKLYNIAKELHIPLMERKWSKIKTIRHNRFRILPQA